MKRLLSPLPPAVLLLMFAAVHGQEQPQGSADATLQPFPTVDQLPEIRQLPNPFVFLDGTPVKNRGDWARRRKEMKAIGPDEGKTAAKRQTASVARPKRRSGLAS